MKLGELLVEVQYVELTPEQEKHIREYLKLKTKGYKPKEKEEYFYVDDYGDEEPDTWLNHKADEFRLLTNNVFQTEKEASFHLEKIKTYHELRQFAEVNNEELKNKWYITYDKYSNRLRIIDIGIEDCFIGEIYFSSRELCEQAIEKVGKDRILKYLFGVANEKEN